MARRAQVIAQATDYAGALWDVREARPTSHGFDVLIGWPRGEPRGMGGRGVATILSVELARYLAERQLRPRDIDLPIGGTTIKRLRRELGLRWSWDEWWESRIADLDAMTLEAFCALHGCSIGAASQRRTAMRQHDT